MTGSICRFGMLGRLHLHPLARCPPSWAPLRAPWPSTSSGTAPGSRLLATQPDRLPPPDVRKLAQLAQIAVTDEQVWVGYFSRGIDQGDLCREHGLLYSQKMYLTFHSDPTPSVGNTGCGRHLTGSFLTPSHLCLDLP